MPIKRKQGETKDEFISRCIPIEINSGKPEEQAAAICYSYWEEKQLMAVKNIRKKKLNTFESFMNFEKQRVFVNSSNVSRMMWNSETFELVIKFNDGSYYTYFEVDEDTFIEIAGGNAMPITTDTQNPPRWIKGQKPSVGAAVHQYLIDKKVKYQKGGSFR